MAENHLKIKNLRVSFRTFEGMKNVLNLKSLEVRKGQSFGLVGESGAGKTILSYTILRLLPIPPAVVESGQIFLEGTDLLKEGESSMRQIRGKRISMIFQDPMSSLNPVFTVGQQITRVLEHNQGMNRTQAAKRAIELMDLVKISDPQNTLSKYPHELSGGQRQRIVIALAFSCGAEFLIADEPTRNLDVTIQAGILKLIAELIERMRVTVLFIANSLELVSLICDHVGILQSGQLVELGTVKEIVRKPLHPYTLTLLRSIPKKRGEKIDLAQIITEEEKKAVVGCRFANRCPRKMKICEEKEPEFALVEGTHFVSCHLYTEGQA